MIIDEIDLDVELKIIESNNTNKSVKATALLWL